MSTQKNTVTIKTGTAKYLADGMLAATTKDDWTPVLNAALFTVADGKLTGMSTDRYRVHMMSVDVEGPSKPHEFLMHRDLLLWLSKNAATYNRASGPYTPIVTITTRAPGDDKDDHGLCEITIHKDASVSTDTLKMTGTLVKGKFPPMQQMFEKARAAQLAPADLRLNLDFVASVRALSPERGFAPKIRFTANEANPEKPGPAHILFSRGEKTYAEALIQPNLSL